MPTKLIDAMRDLQPHQLRVVVETVELETRLSALKGFLQTETFKTLHINERARLQRQGNHMQDYLLVLQERIEAFDTPDKD